MSILVKHPLPAEFSHEGVALALRDLIGCDAEWIANHEVTIPTPGGAWWGFVHEFRLTGHPTAVGCFVVRCRGGDTYTYLKDASVRSAEVAVRRMLADSQPE